MDTTKLLADAEQVVADVQALTVPPVVDVIATITVTWQSGAVSEFVPKQ